MNEAGPERTGRLSLTIDHVGIYLGVNGGDKRRFSSSRKTVNGPTAARPCSTARGRTPGHCTPCVVSEPGQQSAATRNCRA